MKKGNLLRRYITTWIIFFAFLPLIIIGNTDVMGQPPDIDENDIGGEVISEDGPEVGVWVIAETRDLLTNFRKIVVTDEEGKFVVPDLPVTDANGGDVTYDVWVRGYGLMDSDPVEASPGETLTLEAVIAESPHEAAEIYPANYWYSLYEPPAASDFPGTGPLADGGNGINPSMQSQQEWISQTKLGCELCHQVGNEHTRHHSNPGQWETLIKKAGSMESSANAFGLDAFVNTYSDWGARIAAGEVPPQPPRPQGIERNFVITQWEWGNQFTYAHDEVATDKRNPFLYPYGKVWGVDLGRDHIIAVDPVTHEAFEWDVPTRGGFKTRWCAQPGFCTWKVYNNPANPHNPMLDENGLLWITTQIRSEAAADRPDFCTEKDSNFIFAGHRQAGYFDTNTEEFALINTCFGTHHLQFDNDGVLWFSGDSAYIGWVDTNEIDSGNCGVESCPSEVDAQDWSQVLVDANGDNVCDTPVFGFHYGIIPNPTDGSVWTGVLAGFPGQIQRFDPATGCHEVYEPPLPGYGPRGIDVDTEGNIWTCLGGSGHVAKFDRSQCAQTWGTGDQCSEGWTLWETPGPQMKGAPDGPNDGSADFHYYNWVDQFNTLGMGENTVICNGTGSDSLLAFNHDTEQFTIIRVPYPLTFYQRGLDGRIDDPAAGWKGRGLWVDYGNDPIKHVETGMGQVAQVQFRPDPLAH